MAAETQRGRALAELMARLKTVLPVLLAAAIGTGFLMFAVGSAWAALVLLIHATVGTTLLVGATFLLGASRHERRAGSQVVLGVALIATSILGLAHAIVGVESIGGRAVLVMHVELGILSLVPMVWWALRHRSRDNGVDSSRRALLDPARLVGLALLTRGGTEGLVRAFSLPGSRRRRTGSYPRGSFDPGSMPTTMWLRDKRPDIDVADWTLTVRGSTTSRAWTHEELAAFDDSLRATLDCTSGWFATQNWGGVRVDRLVPDGEGGRSLVVRSATGYQRRFPIDDVDHLMLATRVGGEPLSSGHGHPLRLVAPNRRGFWWVKWVVEIEIDDRPWWWQSPFPLG